MENNSDVQQKSSKSEIAERLNEVYSYIKKNTEFVNQSLFAEKISEQRSNLSSALNGNEKYLTKGLLMKVIKNYNREATVIISTHLIADVEKVLDEAIFISKGEILLYQDVKSIINEHNKTVDEYFREVFKY